MKFQENIQRLTSNSQCASQLFRSKLDFSHQHAVSTDLGLILFVCILSVLAGCSTLPAPPVTNTPSLHSHPEVIKAIKQLVEAGQFDMAERAAREVLRTEPDNGAAAYYLAFADEGRRRNAQRTPQPRLWIPTIPPQPIY